MTPRRLLLLSFIPDRPWTGMGRWTHQVAAAIRRQGHEVTTWFSHDFPRTAALGRVAVLAYPVAVAARIARHAPAFDAVVLHEPGGFWYGALRRRSSSLPPMLLMCHNVESRHFAITRGYARLGLAEVPTLTRVRAPLLRHWQSDGAIRRADHVLCLSSADQEYLSRRLGVPGTRITRLINGTAPDDFLPRRAAGRSVLWVGGWLDVKGKRVLPRVWNRVRAGVPDAALTLAGTGRDAAGVLADFGPEDRAGVTVLPRVCDPDAMRRLYATHAVFLLTSLSEGSPLALLEAMAASLPCVATNVGGVPDIITHGETGLLFQPEQVATGAAFVQDLLTNEARGAALGAAACARARGLTWDSTAAALLDAVERTLAAGKRA